MTLATLGLNGSLGAFVALAVVMVSVQLVLLYLFLPRPSAPTRPRLSRALVVAYILPSTALMWAVLPGAVLRPSYGTWWAAIQAMMVPMPAPFLWMMSQLARAEERPIDRSGATWPVLLAGAVVANEVVMGYAFAALAGAPSLDVVGTAVAVSINSPWFAGSMIATMLALISWVPAPGWQRWSLVGLSGSAVAGPLWLVDPSASAAVLGAAMLVTALALVQGFGGPTAKEGVPRRFVLAVAGAMSAMTLAGVASALVPQAGAYGLPFALVNLSVMLAETAYLLHRGLAAVPDPTPAFRWSADVPMPA